MNGGSTLLGTVLQLDMHHTLYALLCAEGSDLKFVGLCT